eukprot:9045757-Karenia_brevis.AAC.1
MDDTMCKDHKPVDKYIPSFDKDPDPALLQIGSRVPIAFSSMHSAVRAWLSQHFADKEWALVGNTERIGKSFSVKFNGPPQTAARRAHKALTTLKDESGKWEPLFCKAVDSTKTQIFISPDRNGRQRRLATTVRRAAKVLAENHPGNTFYTNRDR